MSRNIKSNTSVKKPYCKVCHDAGKSESEYTNHWVRTLPDRNGKTTITCPTLLSNECRYCFKLGHTAKFCPVIEQNKKERERTERKIARNEAAVQKKVKTEKKTGGFAALQEDSESETEDINEAVYPVTVMEEFPALGAPSKTQLAVHLPSVKQETKTGWAAALAKPKDQATMSSIHNDKNSFQPIEQNLNKEIYTKNWADWSESDESDNEELVKVTEDDYDSDW